MSADQPGYRVDGTHAPSGAQEYVIQGRMIGGFAVLAYPARYGNSGVMSFIVNHEGTVYEADLGDGTTAGAQTVDSFDPVGEWAVTESE
jgi:hypothetical protein